MYRIRVYQESGLLDHWIRWEKPKFQCLGFGPVTGSSPATMRHFYGAFILMTAGVCLAAFTLLLENLLHRYYTVSSANRTIFINMYTHIPTTGIIVSHLPCRVNQYLERMYDTILYGTAF